MTNGGHANGYDLHSIREAIITANKLVELGYAPFCPQLTVLAELIHPVPYESWLGSDFEWVEVCDVLLRLPGESKGADREVEHAKSKSIPVAYSIEEVLAGFSPVTTISPSEDWQADYYCPGDPL
jgi:hypothetical protein